MKIRHIWQNDNGWQKNSILNKAIVEASADYIYLSTGIAFHTVILLRSMFRLRTEISSHRKKGYAQQNGQ